MTPKRLKGFSISRTQSQKEKAKEKHTSHDRNARVGERGHLPAQTVSVSYTVKDGAGLRKKEADILVLELTKSLNFSLFQQHFKSI